MISVPQTSTTVFATHTALSADPRLDMARKPQEGPVISEHALDEILPFIEWIRSMPHNFIIGYSNDSSHDPIGYYLRKRFSAPRPKITSDYWMSDEEFPWYSVVAEVPEWVRRLIYMFDVFGEMRTLTVAQVLRMMRAAELIDDQCRPQALDKK